MVRHLHVNANASAGGASAIAQENVAIAPPHVLDELAFEGSVLPVLPDEEAQDDELVGCELANKTWIKYGEQSQ